LGRIIHILLVGCCILPAASCQPKPAYLSPTFSCRISSKTSVPSCNVRVVSLEDARYKKNSIGAIAGREIYQEHLLRWVTSGLEAAGFTIADPSSGGQSSAIDVAVRVLKVHGRSVSTSMCADVVLESQFRYRGKILQKEVIRGQRTQMNMASGDGEIAQLYDRALKDALLKMAQESQSWCQELALSGGGGPSVEK